MNVTEVSPSPVNFQQPDGSWTDINTKVTTNADGTMTVPDNPLHPEFANSANDQRVLSVSNGDYSLSFTLLEGESSSYAHRATPSEGPKNSEVTYHHVTADGDDLSYLHCTDAHVTNPPTPGIAAEDCAINGTIVELVKVRHASDFASLAKQVVPEGHYFAHDLFHFGVFTPTAQLRHEVQATLS